MVLIGLLRAVNVGGRNLIRMEALRAICKALKFRDVQTYVQSGNVVFKTDARDPAPLAGRIEKAIEKSAGFRPSVILRTTAEMRDVIARNPFAGRRDIEPGKLLVVFLASDPGAAARDAVQKIKTDPEELRASGGEVYIYYPGGMGRSKLSWTGIEKMLKVAGTGRNWNTVTKLLAMAEELDKEPRA